MDYSFICYPKNASKITFEKPFDSRQNPIELLTILFSNEKLETTA